MNTQRPFTLNIVSDRRKHFLSEWSRERAIEKQLCATHVAPESTSEEQSDLFTVKVPKARAFDFNVKPGDVRLLSPGQITDERRLAYIAVLDLHDEDGFALVAPFSKYAYPAVKDEWLTGLDSTPLRVLQLWNATPMPRFLLAQSWRCCSLTDVELVTARDLYRHAIAGTWPEAGVREQTGLAIHDPSDERLAYQEEELAIYAPIKGTLYRLLNQMENAPTAYFKEGTLSFTSASKKFAPPALPPMVAGLVAPASLKVALLTAKNVFKTFSLRSLQLASAQDGETLAQVTLLCKDGSTQQLFARQISHDSSVTEWESRWVVEQRDFLLPGLPVFAYSSKSCKESAPISTTFTGGETGLLLRFVGTDLETYEQFKQPDLWFIIQEV